MKPQFNHAETVMSCDGMSLYNHIVRFWNLVYFEDEGGNTVMHIRKENVLKAIKIILLRSEYHRYIGYDLFASHFACMADLQAYTRFLAESATYLYGLAIALKIKLTKKQKNALIAIANHEYLDVTFEITVTYWDNGLQHRYQYQQPKLNAEYKKELKGKRTYNSYEKKMIAADKMQNLDENKAQEMRDSAMLMKIRERNEYLATA
jgi:hypothetical protein